MTPSKRLVHQMDELVRVHMRPARSLTGDRVKRTQFSRRQCIRAMLQYHMCHHPHIGTSYLNETFVHESPLIIGLLLFNHL
jgi:hypothetical protein